ncbi:zonadhesin-like [Photinus pyralis]|nr:zonadhesin-like [Photinus pyralis]
MTRAKYIVLLIAVSAIAVPSDGADDSNEGSIEEFVCKENEIFTDCSTPCPPTCKDRVTTCDYVCKTGCVCKPDYIREEIGGKCIPIRDCKNECSRNQIWQECSDTLCKKTCSNIDSVITCPTPCNPGCSCKEEYVWDDELTNCVSKWECPAIIIPSSISLVPTTPAPQPPITTTPSPITTTPPPITTTPSPITTTPSPITTTPSPITTTPSPITTTPVATTTTPVAITTTPAAITTTPAAITFSYDLTTTTPVPTTTTLEPNIITQVPKVCGNNQVWEQCSDKFCRRTCENINGPVACLDICLEGCSCMHGFIWNQDETECIPVEDCASECGLNQHWSQCSDIQCRRTCANFGQDVPCPQMCMSGCTCDSGYVWNSNETECIQACDCGKDVCLENEEWGGCANPECKRTCQNTNEKACSDCFPGCVCREGYIWDEIAQKCVPEDHCSGCGINANMSSCTSGCEPTCQGPSPFPCPAVCIPGCACLPGYLMDHHQGHCVLPSECSSVCPRRKTWCRDLPTNRVTCQNILYPQCNYQSNENQTSYPGCVCKEGLILNELTNECITPRHCMRLLR